MFVNEIWYNYRRFTASITATYNRSSAYATITLVALVSSLVCNPTIPGPQLFHLLLSP